MSEACQQIAENLRRWATQLEELASPRGCSRPDNLAQDAIAITILATRQILKAADHCPDLLGSLRPGKWGGTGAPVVCPDLDPRNAEQVLRYWQMCALPWLRSCCGSELPSSPIRRPEPHIEPGKMTAKQQRKLKRLCAAYEKAVREARAKAVSPPASEAEEGWPRPPARWQGKDVDLPAIRERIDREDPTSLDVPPVLVVPDGYDEGWRMDDWRREARYWAAAMRAFAGIIGVSPGRADGTIQDSHIWLKGKPYRLPPGLRDLLSFLLSNNGTTEAAVIHHCAFGNSSHLHKRLKDLRDRLETVLKRSNWRLQIKTKDTSIFCDFSEKK